MSKFKYLEDLEKEKGESLNKFGLTKEESKLHKKDVMLECVLYSLHLALVWGFAIFFIFVFPAFFYDLAIKLSGMATLIGVFGAIIINVILKKTFPKIIKKKSNKENGKYSTLPFCDVKWHSSFKRCPSCGHKFDIIKTEEKGVKGGVLKLDYYDRYTNEYKYSTTSAWADATDAKGYTEYACPECKFKMKGEFTAVAKKYEKTIFITYDTKFKPLSKCNINTKDIIKEYNCKTTKKIEG